MFYRSLTTSSLIQTLTVGIGISPIQRITCSKHTLRSRTCFASGTQLLPVSSIHRRWGLSPRPEDALFSFASMITCRFDNVKSRFYSNSVSSYYSVLHWAVVW